MPAKPDKLVPALYGGILIAVLASIPLVNCCCCIIAMGGGLLAVYFYKNTLKPESMPLESSDGVQLGLLAGAFGAVIAVLISIVIQLIFGNVGSKMVIEFLDRLAESGNIPPEAMEGIDRAREELERSLTEGFQLINVVKAFAMSIIVYPLFGLFGGLIGASWFKPKQPPVFQQPPPAVPMA
jgi:hypothetical protein